MCNRTAEVIAVSDAKLYMHCQTNPDSSLLLQNSFLWCIVLYKRVIEWKVCVKTTYLKFKKPCLMQLCLHVTFLNFLTLRKCTATRTERLWSRVYLIMGWLFQLGKIYDSCQCLRCFIEWLLCMFAYTSLTIVWQIVSCIVFIRTRVVCSSVIVSRLIRW